MTRLLLFSLIMLFLEYSSYGQKFRDDLLVYRESETNPTELINKVKTGIADTNQINSLNKLARIYWYKRRPDNYAVDSTLLYARQAYAMSKNIHFEEGHKEAVFLICKGLLEKKNFTEAIQLTNDASGAQLVRLLIIIAEPYVFHNESTDAEFQKALPLIEKAIKVSEQIHSLKWSNECINLLAKYHYKQGDVLRGKEDMMRIINSYHKIKDYENEAKYWSRLGTNMPENNSTYPIIIHAHKMAVRNYLLANNKKEAGYSLRYLAVIRGNHNQSEQAGKDLLQMLRLFKSINEKLSLTTYYILSDYYRFVGKYDQALYYGFEGVKAAGDNLESKTVPYVALAATYGLLKDYKKALNYYQIILDYRVKRELPSMFITCYNIANLQAESGNPKQALLFLNQFLTEHPPVSVNHQQLFASTYGYIYGLLGKYKLAESYYRKMLSLEEKADQENGKNFGTHLTLVGGGADYLMGKFYVERGRFQEARSYLLKSLHNPQYFDKDQEFKTNQLLFKADSARGDYISAIKYFQRQKALDDSINSVARTNQISELNIRFETAQRAKDIELLENKQKLQQEAIEKSNTIKNFTIGAAILLFLLACSAYLGYRNKRQSNLLLHLQQQQINDKNEELQLLLFEKDELIFEKDDLLKEKDWLLKEVHHRVKNNLQIIMSLLRTQVANLKTEDAKDAIIESEHRVQAIALIHQKLYNTDKLASISMPAYVSGLVDYLSHGLVTKDQNAKFNLSIDTIHLDLAQAVPIGLILNEAVTNAIKYGLNDSGTEINITLQRLDHENALLTISDKGKGFANDFDLVNNKSLGMQIIKGLSKQLRGTLIISSKNGVAISIQFKVMPVLLSGPNVRSVSMRNNPDLTFQS